MAEDTRTTAMMKVSDVLAQYAPGDPHSWETEFGILRHERADRLDELRPLIRAQGIRSPILLGDDGRVWDGHHRLCLAVELGIPLIRTRQSKDVQ